MKMAALYINIVGGALLYRSLRKNLGLPSRQVVLDYLYSSRNFVEGEFTFKELADFITHEQTVPYVWVSEDDTKCVSALRYNSKADTVVGLVLPTNEEIGAPLIDFYRFTTIEEVQGYMKQHEKSSYIKLISARSLHPKSKTFILVLYGTSGSDNSAGTIARWAYVKEQLEMVGIKVMGNSSDGATPLLKAMQEMSGLSCQCDRVPKLFKSFFFAKWSPENSCVINDPMHLFVKLFRRLMLRTMMIGVLLAARAILVELLERHGKAVCGLTPSHLTQLKDAMNYDVALKTCSERIINLLTEPNQLATKLFIQLNHYIRLAFIERDTDVETRIYYAWYIVFFCRIWRSHVLSTKGRTLKNDFLSSNSYVCIEINAHNLLLFLVKCRDLNMPHLFLPFLASSQDCEGLFRLFRALGTTFHTTVNFNVLELLHKARRVAAVIQFEDLIDPKFFKFEKKQKAEPFVPKMLPTDEKLYGLIMSSLEQARLDQQSLGNASEYEAPLLALIAATDTLKQKKVKRRKVTQVVPDINEDEEMLAFADAAFDETMITSALKDNPNASEAPPGFINTISASGPKVLRKPTVLWSLTDQTEHVSQDRQRRFIENRKKKNAATNDVVIGQFVKLKLRNKRVVGQVLGFVALTGKKETLRITSCPVVAPKTSGKRGIGLLVNLFSVNSKKQLSFESSHKDPIDISNYVAHLNPSELIFAR